MNDLAIYSIPPYVLWAVIAYTVVSLIVMLPIGELRNTALKIKVLRVAAILCVAGIILGDIFSPYNTWLQGLAVAIAGVTTIILILQECD